MHSRLTAVLGVTAAAALTACASLPNTAASTSFRAGQAMSQRSQGIRTELRRSNVTSAVSAAAARGDLAAFASVTNALRPGAMPAGTRLFRINTPGACGATVHVASCYAIVPVLPGKAAPVDVSGATATYVVP